MKDQKPCSCGSKYIVNKTYNMCDECNYYRLHKKTPFEASKEKESGKGKKVYKLKVAPLKRKNSPIRSTSKTKEKRQEVLREDRELYKYIFDTKPHECEECGMELPDVFENEDGDIICISQYSHILSKASAPEFRHNKLNINRICPDCHDVWEFGDKGGMKIHQGNQLIIEKLRSGK